jgi:hypothetical protein
MTGADLIDLFLTRLLRAHGGTRRRWKQVLGDVRVYDVATHPHCNWSLTPAGEAGEIAAVERIADRVRGEHPVIET